MLRTVADHVADPRHAGATAGATLTGEAARPDGLCVTIGFWLDASGTVIHARFKAATCASLIAYADAACALAEQGVSLDELDSTRVRGSVAGVHPIHYDRAALVAAAVRRAIQPPTPAKRGTR